MARCSFSILNSDAATVAGCLSILKGKNLINEREPGKFVRQVLDDQTGACRLLLASKETNSTRTTTYGLVQSRTGYV